jgi:hypothetical protein
MAVELRKPQNLKSILGHCERVVSIVQQQRLEGSATEAIVAICQRERNSNVLVAMCFLFRLCVVGQMSFVSSLFF